jgi:hypothetical protein
VVKDFSQGQRQACSGTLIQSLSHATLNLANCLPMQSSGLAQLCLAELALESQAADISLQGFLRLRQ